MVIYSRGNYNLLKYLAHGIRVYCCGYDAENTASWILLVNRGLNGIGAVYHYDKNSDEYSHLDNYQLVEEMEVMDESTFGVFHFTGIKSMSQTLLLMGYSIMTSMRGVVIVDASELEDEELITNTAESFNMHICHSVEETVKYLLGQWKDKEGTHITRESKVMV